MLERVSQQPRFHVCCLGRFKLVEAGSGTDMTPPSRKARALVAYLCIVGRPVGRERLASLLWGDRGDEQARASLRQAIYELRSMLSGDRLLNMERDTVAVGDDVSTDVDTIIAAAQSGDLEQLGQALSAWRGDFFEDLPSIDESFDTWLQSERHRVQENLVNAAVEAAKTGMARGDVGRARKIIGQIQQRDGTNEIVLRLGLELDYLAGDSAGLHRRYERFREQIKAELDATPSEETQRLLQDLVTRSSVRTKTISFAVSANEFVRRTVHSEEPLASASIAEADVGTSISRSPRYTSRLNVIAGSAIAVVAILVLAWALHSFVYRSVSSSEGTAPNFSSGSSLSADEDRLLAIDTNAERSDDNVPSIERAARVAADRALARNPNDGEALGVVALLTSSAHLPQIDRLFERALRAEPNNAQLLNWHARFLMTVGRSHEALDELTRAYEHDRTAPSIAANLALAFLVTGKFEEARKIIDSGRGGEAEDRFFSLHVKYFLYQRDWFGLANYLRDLPDGLSLPRADFFRLCRETAVAFVMREADKFGPLRASWRTETRIDPDDAVQFLSALGDDDGALAAVQSMVRSRRNDDLLIDPGWEPLFGPNVVALRRDPRVAALFAQWGLFDYWKTVNHSPDFMR